MRKFKVNVYFDRNADHEGEGTTLTLCGIEGERMVLNLNEEQAALLKARFTRSFYVRCPKETLLCDIDRAGSHHELGKIAKKYYLCDTCEFGDINLYGAKRILKAVVEILYRFPKLRSKLCFIGTQYEMEKLIVRLEEGDGEVLNTFDLQYICTNENARNLGKLVHKNLSFLIREHEKYVAIAMSAFGLFDAVLLDKNDYGGYAYLQFISNVRRNEMSGFHPEGCHTPESVVYHELGHLLDDMCKVKEDPEFKTFYDGLDQEDIKNGLSEYALTSPAEFVAEAFAEFMGNPTPRPIAAKVGKMIESIYKQNK